ncbi:MAG: conjugal transfer protein TraB [Desulfobacterales bacterium]
MTSIDEQILKATKEIVVKFIETGRLSPSGFGETFKSVYRTVEKTVKGKKPQVVEPPNPAK